MAKAQADKRTRLIGTATKLAHLRGFRETSLADIAEAANVPVGNVYYYFKTKDELGEAIVERRLAEFRAFRDEMNRLGSPKERLLALAEQIGLVLADVLRTQAVRRAVEVAGKILHLRDVTLDGSRRVISTLEFFEHHLA